MSHLVETMAYRGQVPWHGLGVQVDRAMSPEEMLVAAGLDWTVSKRPTYTVDKPDLWDLHNPTAEAQLIYCPDTFKLVRDSDNRILGDAGENYQVFQNAEVMSFFKRFTEAGHMEMETAGSLKFGKDIWGLARLKDGFTLPGGDEVKGYLLLNNTHEAGKALTIMFTPIRVVCNNTLTMALNAKGNRFRVLHLQMFDAEIIKAAEEALGISGKQMLAYHEQATYLSRKKFKSRDVENFIAELFQPKLLIEKAKSEEQVESLRMSFNQTAAKVYHAVEGSPGATLESANGTWWGAFNAVTYVVDHHRTQTQEGNALHSAWFGPGAATKRKALELATEYAGK
jgi:phage/plasmid-like protein (TIGR03299 family)